MNVLEACSYYIEMHVVDPKFNTVLSTLLKALFSFQTEIRRWSPQACMHGLQYSNIITTRENNGKDNNSCMFTSEIEDNNVISSIGSSQDQLNYFML